MGPDCYRPSFSANYRALVSLLCIVCTRLCSWDFSFLSAIIFTLAFHACAELSACNLYNVLFLFVCLCLVHCLDVQTYGANEIARILSRGYYEDATSKTASVEYKLMRPDNPRHRIQIQFGMVGRGWSSSGINFDVASKSVACIPTCEGSKSAFVNYFGHWLTQQPVLP